MRAVWPRNFGGSTVLETRLAPHRGGRCGSCSAKAAQATRSPSCRRFWGLALLPRGGAAGRPLPRPVLRPWATDESEPSKDNINTDEREIAFEKYSSSTSIHR